MKTKMIIADVKQDELALMSKKELDLYCEEAAVEARESIRKFAAKARSKLKPKLFRSHWGCVVTVDLPEGEMPNGADAPMRSAIEAAVQSLHPGAVLVGCSSGWGLNSAGAEAVRTVSCLDGHCISHEDVQRRDGTCSQSS